MKRTIYSILILTIIALGCEKVLDIEISDTDRKFVINGLINPDSLFSVNISKSLNVLDALDVKFIEDASVDVYMDNQIIETLTHSTRGNYASTSLYPVAGNEYRIEVSNSELETANAEIIIPQQSVSQISIDTLTIFYEENEIGVVESEAYSSESLKCIIDFNDPGNEENYYWFNVTGMQPRYYWNPLTFKDSVSIVETSFYFNSDDPIIEGWVNWGQDGIIFSDKLFDGNNAEFDIQLDKYMFYELDTTLVRFNLRMVSKEFYLYALTHDSHLNAQEDAFTEPVQVYTNIVNGYGIFAGYTTVSDSIEVISDFSWDDF